MVELVRPATQVLESRDRQESRDPRGRLATLAPREAPARRVSVIPALREPRDRWAVPERPAPRGLARPAIRA